MRNLRESTNIRVDDSPQLVTRRLGRSRRYLAEIVNYARDLKIPVHRIQTGAVNRQSWSRGARGYSPILLMRLASK